MNQTTANQIDESSILWDKFTSHGGVIQSIDASDIDFSKTPLKVLRDVVKQYPDRDGRAYIFSSTRAGKYGRMTKSRVNEAYFCEGKAALTKWDRKTHSYNGICRLSRKVFLKPCLEIFRQAHPQHGQWIDNPDWTGETSRWASAQFFQRDGAFYCRVSQKDGTEYGFWQEYPHCHLVYKQLLVAEFCYVRDVSPDQVNDLMVPHQKLPSTEPHIYPVGDHPDYPNWVNTQWMLLIDVLSHEVFWVKIPDCFAQCNGFMGVALKWIDLGLAKAVF